MSVRWCAGLSASSEILYQEVETSNRNPGARRRSTSPVTAPLTRSLSRRDDLSTRDGGQNVHDDDPAGWLARRLAIVVRRDEARHSGRLAFSSPFTIGPICKTTKIYDSCTISLNPFQPLMIQTECCPHDFLTTQTASEQQATSFTSSWQLAQRTEEGRGAESSGLCPVSCQNIVLGPCDAGFLTTGFKSGNVSFLEE